MGMDLDNSIMISAAGMRAQSLRMRIIAENLANADSVAPTAGGTPYQRKSVSFQNVMDRTLGVETVKVNKVNLDKSPFGSRYDPGHPSADANGYVKTPNVNSLVETMDMRQAQRSYEANVSAVESSKAMISRTLEILK